MPLVSPRQLELLRCELETGSTLADACKVAGLNYNSIRSRVCYGAKRYQRDAEIRALVREAVSNYDLSVRQMVFANAANGSPRAMDEVLRRLERVKAELQQDKSPPTDRREWVEWRLAMVRACIDEESGIARTRLIDTERDLMTELSQFSDDRPMSYNEILEALAGQVPGWSDDMLLIAHAEGLRREIPGFTERSS